MTRKRRRMNFIILGLLTFGVAAALVLTALEDKIVFFYSPTDIVTKKQIPGNQQVRVGGLVKEGTWKKPTNDLTHKFTVTDLRHDILILYKGIIPDIFREGQGVVVQDQHRVPAGAAALQGGRARSLRLARAGRLRLARGLDPIAVLAL